MPVGRTTRTSVHFAECCPVTVEAHVTLLYVDVVSMFVLYVFHSLPSPSREPQGRVEVGYA